MASDLDTARTLIDAGDHKKALKHLWVVEAQAREDVGSAQSLLELASRLQDATTGGARSESELLVGYAQNHIDRLTRQPDVRRDRVSCTALGGFGWPLAPGLPYELDFDERGVSIYEPVGDAVTAHRITASCWPSSSAGRECRPLEEGSSAVGLASKVPPRGCSRRACSTR
jgi:hypothetical protein